jgi:hypothetical protein
MRIDLGFSVIGSDPSQKETYYVHISRKDVIKRINNHPAIDPWTKKYLIGRVNEYPDNALVYFVQNINQIVIAALNERSRVLKEENERQREKEASSESNLSFDESSSESGSGIGDDSEEEHQEEIEEREDLFSRRASSGDHSA